MKNLILVLYVLLISNLDLIAQCQNEVSSIAPVERVKNRLRPGNSRYGNPYTMFKMETKDFDFSAAINQIRLNIKTGTQLAVVIFSKTTMHTYTINYL